jgi:TfoX/Sxy family transcriptional regulator of competence genes
MPGMSMPKGDSATIQRFRELVPKSPGIEVRKMFGHEAAFVHGNLFFGTFGTQIFVRLGEKERSEALSIPGAAPFAPMAGRPMAEYVVLPASLWGTRREAEAWVERSKRFALTLPAKTKKARSAGSKGK